ncbi:MAG: PilZ domain-containing protein [Candidatus Electrothrix sp. GW3-4]|uniref:PilZ domain-containing protein n=1 Tax=Candidatus Electrothrix sp. GW3-4 TaxID=3126740 RepID=UPI0030D4DF8D
MSESLDKRRRKRAKIKGYIVDIADRNFFFDGIVEDISLEGLRLIDVPDRFVVENKKYNLVISGGPESVNIKLTVTPRWIKKSKPYMAIGFQIIDAPPMWKKFVQQFMPKQKEGDPDDCVWENFSGSSLD